VPHKSKIFQRKFFGVNVITSKMSMSKGAAKGQTAAEEEIDQD